MIPTVLTLLLAASSPSSEDAGAATLEEGFLHHVFFWLKEPENEQARKEFLSALEEIKKIPTIRRWYVGTPAGTPRDVVDNSWTFYWLVTFKDEAGWRVYNEHPIHEEFRKKAYLWEKVLVYDIVPVR
ncbi:MAG: Dabb family protein [Acidobacteriota bacterium]